MIEMDIQADEDAEPTRFGVKMRTIFQWEKRFRGRSLAMLGSDNLKVTYLYEIAWLVMGDPAGMKLDEFCDKYDVSPVDDTQSSTELEQANPTPAEV